MPTLFTQGKQYMDLSSPDCMLTLLFPSLSRALPIPMPYLNLLI